MQVVNFNWKSMAHFIFEKSIHQLAVWMHVDLVFLAYVYQVSYPMLGAEYGMRPCCKSRLTFLLVLST